MKQVRGEPQGPAEAGSLAEAARTVRPSNCCYAHDWPYFRDPVPPYDYGDDRDLDAEWRMRLRAGPGR